MTLLDRLSTWSESSSWTTFPSLQPAAAGCCLLPCPHFCPWRWCLCQELCVVPEDGPNQICSLPAIPKVSLADSYRVFHLTGPPPKSSMYGTGPPQQEKNDQVHWSHPRHINKKISSTVVQIIYSYTRDTAAIETLLHTFLPSKCPPPTATQALALSFIFKTDLTTMACLWLLILSITSSACWSSSFRLFGIGE